MELGRSGKPGRTPLLDVYEDVALLFDTPGSSASGRALYAVGNDGATIGTLYTSQGGVAPAIEHRAMHMVKNLSPGVNTACALSLKYALPLGRALSVLPPSFRQSRRIWWETAIARTFPFTQATKFEFGVKDDPGNELALVNSYGVVLQSLSTLNGGAWTLQTKANGAGVVNVTNTGIVPDGTPQHLALEYYDAVSPLLNFWINGAVRASLDAAALAAITPFSGEPAQMVVHNGGNPNVAGQVDWQYNTRLLIEAM